MQQDVAPKSLWLGQRQGKFVNLVVKFTGFAKGPLHLTSKATAKQLTEITEIPWNPKDLTLNRWAKVV